MSPEQADSSTLGHERGVDSAPVPSEAGWLRPIDWVPVAGPGSRSSVTPHAGPGSPAADPSSRSPVGLGAGAGSRTATGYLRLLDQTLLPHEERYLRIDTVDALIDAITRLATRGAPALGVAGAFGVVLAAQTLPDDDIPAAIARIRAARPTAVNLAVGTDRAADALARGGPNAALDEALRLRDEEIRASSAMARRGADELYRELAVRSRNAQFGGATAPAFDTRALRLMTICNTGALAAVERGTALSVVEEVLRDGRLGQVYACETRPLLQGARLTAWELARLGAPHELIVDSAAASLMHRGYADAVLVGADRIAANGDAANKIGTFALALAARYAGIPFYVVAPETTIDVRTAGGADITIEDRGSAEVVSLRGTPIAPAGTTALNPAFDVTPAELITAIITDRRVIHPGAGERPDDLPAEADSAAECAGYLLARDESAVVRSATHDRADRA